MDTIRKGMRWSGPLDHVFITHLSGLDRGPRWSTAAFRDPVQWALGVLGLADGTASRRRIGRVQRQFRDLLRDAHPDHGGDSDDAAQRIADLTEARRILLRVVSAASGRKPGAALLFPGAGSSRKSPSLIAIEEALAPLPVWRRDFPYRREGRKAPDRAAEAARLRRGGGRRWPTEAGVGPERILLGGRSMGGRICSMAVAEGLPAAGLVLISYPLHPPGRPDRLRIEHLPALEVPCLFVSGTRDAFGTPAELERHTAAIPGAGHPRVDRRQGPRPQGLRPAHRRRGRPVGEGSVASRWWVGGLVLPRPAG